MQKAPSRKKQDEYRQVAKAELDKMEEAVQQGNLAIARIHHDAASKLMEKML
jgi:hypothetical protein